MVGEIVNILGISAFYHDSAACLVTDGEVVSAAQEERFTRRKHDQAFPLNAIEFCLKSNGLRTSDLDLIAFYDKPFLKFERLLETYFAYAPKGIRSFLMAMPIWMKQKLWIKEIIRTKLGGYEGKILFPEHHESHAASAFFPSPFSEAAILTIDGVGEWTTTSYGYGCGNRIELLAQMQFPHSLGLLYSSFTYYLGFKVNSGEYKVMGLAPYGKPVYKDVILQELIDLKDDGSFRLNMEYFNFPAGLTMTGSKFHELFGALPRRSESGLSQRDMDLARSIQEVAEEIVLRMAKHIRVATSKEYLCMAGGVALNCVANGRLLREGVYRDIWIQPAAGDAGGALGAALFAWYQCLGNDRSADGLNDFMKGGYLGPEFSGIEIKAFLDKSDIQYCELGANDIARQVADLIADGKVVGWFQGRMEFGPRALGGRSIIGDARSPEMQSIMNLKIKFRESFRPFAPSVLAERAADYFDIGKPSPYMLLVADLVKDRQRPMTTQEMLLEGGDKLKIVRSDIPAVTHVDYSARIQTVHKDTNKLYHDMIECFDKTYGCPVIINTSFNVRGEPIVCTPEDAYRCFMRTNMDYLIMDSILLDKSEQKPILGDNAWQTEFELD